MSANIQISSIFSTPISDLNSKSLNWSDPYTIFKSIAFSFLTTATILENGVLLIAVTFDKRLRQSLPNLFIVNLAVADLLVGLLVIPYSAWESLTDNWPFGSVFCYIWSLMDVWCCCASIFSLCVITVDRYIAITRPLSYPQIMTHRRHLYLIFGVWVVSGIVSLVPIVVWPEVQPSGQFCIPNSGLAHVLASCFGAFFIPMVVILVLYWRIYKEAARVGVSLRLEQENTLGTLRIHVGGNNLANDKQGSIKKETTNFVQENKALWTIGIITGAFIICWFPFFTILLLTGLNVNFEIRNQLFGIFIWLGYSNSCLNPIIYIATNRRFKNGLLNCAKQICGKSTVRLNC